ncbi:MAG TPA: hypothetical protein PKB11_10485 [Desulfovibrio sp.]|uniref:ornithine cyclodeaminase family domain n=1 Tax=Desulfovibrio sp. TaxID=885 RepID=UPI002C3CBF44|nr:hypothetical protein [Desulfovibrio sp.]HMM39170.1 hypothetical protein [Desulfovibrio sp.]
MPRAFDLSKLTVLPLSERHHDLNLSVIHDLTPTTEARPELQAVAERILRARERGAAVVLMMGAHVIRAGVQRYVIDLMERGLVTCLAGNGACAIHDFELALIGQTTESVAHYIKDGRFGLWSETGRLNDVVSEGAARGLGVGQAVGEAILDGDFPHQDVSLFAAARRLDIPFTVHVSMGYDIVHEHPNCDGAAWGAASHKDFLHFAAVLESLEGGVVMNFGSAVMAPEVYLKALAMVRNVAAREDREVRHFTTLVCDLRELPADFSSEAPKNSAEYYFRPWKTMLVRTVADGGESYYVRGMHNVTIPELWTALTAAQER